MKDPIMLEQRVDFWDDGIHLVAESKCPNCGNINETYITRDGAVVWMKNLLRFMDRKSQG